MCVGKSSPPGCQRDGIPRRRCEAQAGTQERRPFRSTWCLLVSAAEDAPRRKDFCCMLQPLASSDSSSASSRRASRSTASAWYVDCQWRGCPNGRRTGARRCSWRSRAATTTFSSTSWSTVPNPMRRTRYIYLYSPFGYGLENHRRARAPWLSPSSWATAMRSRACSKPTPRPRPPTPYISL